MEMTADAMRTSVAWGSKDAALRAWVDSNGGSAYLKALAQEAMDEAGITATSKPTDDGWHDVDDASYYVEDGMVTRATVGEGQATLPAYLYLVTRSGALSGIEFPRAAREVARMLLSGRWIIHN